MIRCKKMVNGVLVTSNVTMKIFYADCTNKNLLCNAFSSAYVPAVTVCALGL